jgi:tight adherence protein C
MPARVRARVFPYLPRRWVGDRITRERLVRAGFDGDDAAHAYAAVRITLLVALPAATVLIGLGRSIFELAVGAVVAVVVAWVVPSGVLDAIVQRRQQRIRRAIPDALDLLVVCVEAGSSIESAIHRVGRDLLAVHPDLAKELLLVLRKTRTGVSRTEALSGLHTRTGVDELRLIAAYVIQGDRFRTSVAQALRAAAAALHRKRRHAAERQAADAPVKMILVIVTLLLPPVVMISYQLSTIRLP